MVRAEPTMRRSSSNGPRGSAPRRTATPRARHRAALPAGVALIWAPYLSAQPATPQTTAPPEPEGAPTPVPTDAADADDAPPTVEIRGQRRRRLQAREVLTSVSIVRQEEIRNESVNEPLDLLRRVPGVYTEQFNQGIITSEVGIRGFGTQGDTPSLKLLIDGIPSNSHFGVPDMKAVFPLEIDRLELVRGTNDARYGLHAVAGSLHVHTREGGNEGRFRALLGGFGVREGQATSAFESERFSQNLFGGFRFAEGYREHSELQRYALSGKWYVSPTDALRVGFIGRLFRMEAEAPGYLTLDQAEQDPRASVPFSSSDGGIQTTRHGSVHLDWDVSDEVFWWLKGYQQRFHSERWVRFTEANPQQLRFARERQTGALTQLTYRPGAALGLAELAFSAGAEVHHQDNLFGRLVTENRVTQATTRAQAFDVLSTSAFAQAEVRPLPWLGAVVGLRFDRLDGELDDLLGASEPTPMIDFGGIWQPKLSAVVSPLPGFDVYANYGRTFQVPAGDGLYSTQALTWSKNDGIEVGIKAQPLPDLRVRAAYFRQTASDEVRLVFDSDTDSENVGETLRQGLDAELHARPLQELALWTSFTVQHTERVEPGRNLAALKGTELDHIPRYLLKAGVDFQPLAEPLVASAWVHAQSSYSLTNAFNYEVIGPNERYGGFTLVNLDVTYTWRSLTFGGHVKNLFDARWDATVWNDGAVTLVNPGDGRAVLASIETVL